MSVDDLDQGENEPRAEAVRSKSSACGKRERSQTKCDDECVVVDPGTHESPQGAFRNSQVGQPHQPRIHR
jgi:hypothetical protein